MYNFHKKSRYKSIKKPQKLICGQFNYINICNNTVAVLPIIRTARKIATPFINLSLFIYYTPKSFLASSEISLVFSSDSALVSPQAVI